MKRNTRLCQDTLATKSIYRAIYLLNKSGVQGYGWYNLWTLEIYQINSFCVNSETFCLLRRSVSSGFMTIFIELSICVNSALNSYGSCQSVYGLIYHDKLVNRNGCCSLQCDKTRYFTGWWSVYRIGNKLWLESMWRHMNYQFWKLMHVLRVKKCYYILVQTCYYVIMQ